MTDTDTETWERDHRRYFEVGGITIQVDSDLPFSDASFSKKFESFRVEGPGPDTVRIHHHFSIPELRGRALGKSIFRRPPWAIYRDGNSWIYAGIPPDGKDFPLHQYSVFSEDLTSGDIYNSKKDLFLNGNINSLTLFPSDQILIAPLLADRDGCCFHSSGAVMDDKGLLFVGQSEAGKTTAARMMMPYSEILCDERNIVRRHDDGWKLYGTWSHGELTTVSSRSAPLHAILFLEKARVNKVRRIDDRREVFRRLLVRVVRPLTTAHWWEKTLLILELMAQEVPCYRMDFDLSGDIVQELKRL